MTRGGDGTPITSEGKIWQTMIHEVFILPALGIAYTDHLMLGASASKPVMH